MAQDDLLSQEEIDALLGGGGDANGQGEGEGASRIRPYDPTSQQRIIRQRLQTLDIINERFARLFRQALFNLLRRSADLTVEGVRYLSFKDFTRNVPVPTNINLFSVKPLRGTALLVFPPSLVFMVVDNLFGGDGRFVTKSEGREFTNTEQRIIRRLLDLALEAYEESWKSVFGVSLSYLRSEMQARFANITNSPNEIVVNTNFHLEVGNLASDFQICMPYSMIEPLRDLLSNPVVDGGGDKTWSHRMAGELRNSQVELVTEFVSLPATMGQVMSMKVGDILPMELPETVIASVDGVPVMECEYGRRDDRHALRVLKMFDHTQGNLRPDKPFVKGSQQIAEEARNERSQDA